MDTVILDPIIPYVGPIGGGSFSPKKSVTLEGTIPSHAYGFDINLQCGPNTFPHDDIALQISVRFLNGYIILNSSHEGIWGKDIRLPSVHIEADQKFKITVLCEFNQYKIAINDEHYCIFTQRILYEKVSHLSIDGDVCITRVSYKSIIDSISDSTTPLTKTVNQNVQHLDLPPSYDSAVNHSEDVEAQEETIARITIFHFSSNRRCSPRKALFSYIGLLAVIFLCIFSIALSNMHRDSTDTGVTSYTRTDDIPTVNFKLIDFDKISTDTGVTSYTRTDDIPSVDFKPIDFDKMSTDAGVTSYTRTDDIPSVYIKTIDFDKISTEAGVTSSTRTDDIPSVDFKLLDAIGDTRTDDFANVDFNTKEFDRIEKEINDALATANKIK